MSEPHQVIPPFSYDSHHTANGRSDSELSYGPEVAATPSQETGGTLTHAAVPTAPPSVTVPAPATRSDNNDLSAQIPDGQDAYAVHSGGFLSLASVGPTMLPAAEQREKTGGLRARSAPARSGNIDASPAHVLVHHEGLAHQLRRFGSAPTNAPRAHDRPAAPAAPDRRPAPAAHDHRAAPAAPDHRATPPAHGCHSVPVAQDDGAAHPTAAGAEDVRPAEAIGRGPIFALDADGSDQSELDHQSSVVDGSQPAPADDDHDYYDYPQDIVDDPDFQYFINVGDGDSEFPGSKVARALIVAVKWVSISLVILLIVSASTKGRVGLSFESLCDGGPFSIIAFPCQDPLLAPTADGSAAPAEFATARVPDAGSQDLLILGDAYGVQDLSSLLGGHNFAVLRRLESRLVERVLPHVKSNLLAVDINYAALTAQELAVAVAATDLGNKAALFDKVIRFAQDARAVGRELELLSANIRTIVDALLSFNDYIMRTSLHDDALEDPARVTKAVTVMPHLSSDVQDVLLDVSSISASLDELDKDLVGMLPLWEHASRITSAAKRDLSWGMWIISPGRQALLDSLTYQEEVLRGLDQYRSVSTAHIAATTETLFELASELLQVRKKAGTLQLVNDGIPFQVAFGSLQRGIQRLHEPNERDATLDAHGDSATTI
ncbi:hypothetical protein C8Q76DRAFT_690285 [Earliella scabrosa]|nr:hypothetical protein C8Q76DRAFT_690285 [Earliella scabrosa]